MISEAIAFGGAAARGFSARLAAEFGHEALDMDPLVAMPRSRQAASTASLMPAGPQTKT